MTIDHMPHLAAISAEDDVEPAMRAGYHLGRANEQRAQARPAAQPVRFPTCPAWCNGHSVIVDDEPELCASDHRMTVRGDGARSPTRRTTTRTAWRPPR